MDGGFKIVQLCKSGAIGPHENVAWEKRGIFGSAGRFEFENQHSDTAGAEADRPHGSAKSATGDDAIQEGLHGTAGNCERKAAGSDHGIEA